ncbi:E3 ubiquitin-protein ligase RNF8 isoform X2 [Phascolarctos cinereus]|uniref:E3 ubiquitin-protein ligase RNF8 n=1 Tax=Phascolarctos cinereus TaxID=38626 RepID=A0A6P5LAU2_PHACI|nr:E3 ubiquitin-protein ligase RNF8 isoform X2 [Phascolarctos cinereus]
MGDPGGGGHGDGDGRGRRAWCLRRVGMNAEWLLLEDRSEVTVGRGFDVTYQLLSKICPLMISRNHCVFKQNAEGQWTVMDNKSLNGVWLNKERLEPLKAYPVQEGDRIQLGVPLENKENAEYEYEVVEEDWEKIHLCLALKNDKTVVKCWRTKRKCSLEELDSPGADGSSDSRTKVNKVSHDCEQSGKSCGRAKMAKQAPKSVDQKLASPGPSGERAAEDDLQTVSEKAAALSCKEQKGPSLSQSQSSLDMLKKTMAKILKLKVKVQEKQVAVLSVKQQSHEGAQKETVKMEEELQELQDQLFTEQVQQQQRVEQLEKNFQEKEPHLEHHVLMEELSRSKKDFEAIIQAKNKELELTKEEKEKVRAQKEEVLNQMNDVLENELQCIICSEHFIEAVTLNCAHSFCSYCINEWMKRKVECPICRQDIESKTRSLVLDNCISKMVEKLSSEMKERREILTNERRGASALTERKRPLSLSLLCADFPSLRTVIGGPAGCHSTSGWIELSGLTRANLTNGAKGFHMLALWIYFSKSI